jgi:hypothetical protein
MQMSLLLAHQADFHFRRTRRVFEILAVVIATNRFRFESERRDGAAQFVDVIRGNGFAVVPQQQRTREVQTFRRATRDLIKVLLFFEQRVRRDVLRASGRIPSNDRALRVDRSNRATRLTGNRLRSDQL